MSVMRARLACERGFTMVTVVAIGFIVTMLTVTALSVAQGDVKPGQADKDRKEAYAAAEAGLNYYLFQLTRNPQVWTRCDQTGLTTGGVNPVNQVWNGSGPDPRRWANVPGSTGSRGPAQYTVELLPANGNAACSTASPTASMIDNTTGSFRIRVTGRDNTNPLLARKRSLIVNLRRRGFLDYIYFTDKETRDPEMYAIDTGPYLTKENGSQRDVVTWGKEECGTRYYGSVRSDGDRQLQGFAGDAGNDRGVQVTSPNWISYPFGRTTGAGGNNRKLACTEINFITGDNIKGPFHTNDEIRVCTTGSGPIFGRNPQDNIETSGPGTAPSSNDESATMGWRACSGSPGPDVNFANESPAPDRGTWVPSAPLLNLPPTNTKLKADTDPAYRFKGTTTIVLNGDIMTVTGTRDNAASSPVNGESLAIPADGLVYVSTVTGQSCPLYDPTDTEAAPAACGNLKIQGTYSRNVTFAADNDVILTGSLRRTGSANPPTDTVGADVLLGLISNNFIRVQHIIGNRAFPTSGSGQGQYTCTGAGTQNRTIEAALLSLSHSFVVDNYYCGGTTGTLTVFGAIGQKFRGPVGTSNGGSPTNGYLKAYSYDNRLRFRSPPRFLDPVQAAWRVQTFGEQVPGR